MLYKRPHTTAPLRPELRSLLLWLLVLALCWCSAGTVVWHGARTMCYRYVRLHQQRKCDTLHIAAAETPRLVWVEKDEIRYKGKMFDIKRHIPQEDGSLLLAGHFDETDDKLFKILKKLVDGEREKDSNSQLPVWEYVAVLPYTTWPVVKLTPAAPPYPDGYIGISYISFEASPPVPPPDGIAC